MNRAESPSLFEELKAGLEDGIARLKAGKTLKAAVIMNDEPRAESASPNGDRLNDATAKTAIRPEGQISSRTEVFAPPPQIAARTIAGLRKASGLNVLQFACVMGVSPVLVQAWESGGKTPSPGARRLLQIFAARPAQVGEVLGLPTITIEGVKTVRTAAGGSKLILLKRPAAKLKP